MWEITILTVGKLKNRAIGEEIERLLSKVRGEWKVSISGVPDSEERNVVIRKKKETEALLEKARPDSQVIAMDAAGRQFDSEGFAGLLGGHKDAGRRVTFLVGGAFGLDREALGKRAGSVSLSRLTFSHDLSLLVLCEQIYRAYALYNNIPYSK